MTSEQMDCVEKMLTRFIVKSVQGAKKDYFRKMWKIYSSETFVASVSMADEFRISQSRTDCVGLCAKCMTARICTAMDELTERQEFIIRKLVVEKYTEGELSKQLGITQQAISYHKTEGLKKLRKIASNKHQVGHP